MEIPAGGRLARLIRIRIRARAAALGAVAACCNGFQPALDDVADQARLVVTAARPIVLQRADPVVVLIAAFAEASIAQLTIVGQEVASGLESGERAAREEDWKGVSTGNIHFHRELVALAGSERTDELMRSVLAELRLVFHVVFDPRRLHEPYLTRNQQLLATLEAGRHVEAEAMLAEYLDDSRRLLVDVYGRQVAEEEGTPG